MTQIHDQELFEELTQVGGNDVLVDPATVPPLDLGDPFTFSDVISKVYTASDELEYDLLRIMRYSTQDSLFFVKEYDEASKDFYLRRKPWA